MLSVLAVSCVLYFVFVVPSVVLVVVLVVGFVFIFVAAVVMTPNRPQNECHMHVL